MDNQHLYNLRSKIYLSDEELQLCLSLYFGDGCYVKQSIYSDYGIYTSSIKEDYLHFKKSLLSNLNCSQIKEFNNKGYKKDGKIFKMGIHLNQEISKIFYLSFEEKLALLNELGLALWFYDDGSLHKTKLFYNLNTHAFTNEEQEKIIKTLERFSIYGKLTKETKKDGRIFYYISVGRYSGSYEISKILMKYKINSMEYKLWSSETIQKWSTLQEEWKSKGNQDCDFKKFMARGFRKS